MIAVVLHARSNMRRRLRAWLSLSLLVVLAGGATIALAAGARRTETAYPRFLRSQRAADVQVFLTGDPDPADVARLPNVVDSALAIVLPPTDFAPVVLTDARLGQALNRFKMLAGRPLRPDRPDEAVVGFLLAQNRHLRVGSPLTIEVPPGPGVAAQAVTVRVVGIEAAPGEFPPVSTNRLVAYLSPAFLATPAGAQLAQGDAGVREMTIRLRRGSRDTPAFVSDFRKLLGGAAGGYGLLADSAAEVQRSIHLQAVAIWLLAGAVGLTGALVLFQLLSRHGAENGGDYLALRTLGMTSGQLFASAMVQAAVLATVGALGAIALAGLCSPLLPWGTARIAEPHPGLAFDAVALGLGGVGLVVVVGLVAVMAGARTIVRAATTTSGRSIHRRPSSLESLLTSARLPLVAATGARLALQSGKGRRDVPVRATVVAAAIGLGSVVAAATFAASLAHLLATPGLYGLTFDALLDISANNGDIRGVVPALRADPAVAAVAVGLTSVPLQAHGVDFAAQAMANVEGAIPTTVTAGRLPAGPDEILLGAGTMDRLRTHIGQTLPIALAGFTGPVPMRVVGRGVLPPVGAIEHLGQGAVITPEALNAYAALAPPGSEIPPPGTAFVRFRPGVEKSRAMAAVGATGDVLVSVPTEPTDVANFGQVRRLPAVLAGLLALMAALTIAHLLITSIRRRRRELAVLRALGLVPRQVSWAIAWQATTVVVVAAAIGLPLGLVAGRTAWAIVAGQIGVVVRPTVPVLVVLGLIPSALLVANLVASGPAMAAGRIRPAPALRSE